MLLEISIALTLEVGTPGLLRTRGHHGLPESVVIVSTGTYNDRHGHSMAENERLLACLQTRQHRPQIGRAHYTRENRIYIALIIQQTADARADLRKRFTIDLTRSLIYDQQRHMVLTHLPGDRAKNGLICQGGRKELVRLLYHYNEMLRLTPSTA